MAGLLHRLPPLGFLERARFLPRTLGFVAAALVVYSGSGLGRPQGHPSDDGLQPSSQAGLWAAESPQGSENIQDITAQYHFITADDTLGILEEEGKLKGYIEIYQGEDESDTVLSYSIIRGERKKDHVEFRTNEIHRKYYRFSGKVERGTGHEEGDPDYLRLVGDVEIVTVKGDSREEAVQRIVTVLKSLGKHEREEE